MKKIYIYFLFFSLYFIIIQAWCLPEFWEAAFKPWPWKHANIHGCCSCCAGGDGRSSDAYIWNRTDGLLFPFSSVSRRFGSRPPLVADRNFGWSNFFVYSIIMASNFKVHLGLQYINIQNVLQFHCSKAIKKVLPIFCFWSCFFCSKLTTHN